MPNTAQRDTLLRSTASPAFWKVAALKVARNSMILVGL